VVPPLYSEITKSRKQETKIALVIWLSVRPATFAQRDGSDRSINLRANVRDEIATKRTRKIRGPEVMITRGVRVQATTRNIAF